MNIDYTKFVVPCNICNKLPILKGNTGFICPNCNNEAYVWGGIEFAIFNWNTKNSTIDINGVGNFPYILINNKNYYFASLEVSCNFLGGNNTFKRDIVFFNTCLQKHKWFNYIKNNTNTLEDLTLLSINGNEYNYTEYLNMPRKSTKKSYAYLSLRYSLFYNSSYPCINIVSLSHKYNKIAQRVVQDIK